LGYQEYFKYFVERGIVTNNPFGSINLGRRGKRPKSWQPFTRDELYEVFRYDWDKESRLLLALLVATGMRLEEAVELTWDSFNDTEYQGIKYFSLLSTGFEEVNVKTESSVRYVIIHQDLELPPVLETGRLFSFRHGEAGQKINPVLDTLFNNPRKRVHSLGEHLNLCIEMRALTSIY
jgi:integrase